MNRGFAFYHSLNKASESLNSLWCPRAESNRRHEDFQSSALPTELPGLGFGGADGIRTRDLRRDRPTC